MDVKESLLELLEKIPEVKKSDARQKDLSVSAVEETQNGFVFTIKGSGDRYNQVHIFWGIDGLSVDCSKKDELSFCEAHREDTPRCKHMACAILKMQNDESLVSRMTEKYNQKIKRETNMKETNTFADHLRNLFSVVQSALLYGPTGTGKTYTAWEVLHGMKVSGDIDEIVLIACSDGMEDIDLLARTIPMTPESKIGALKRIRNNKEDIPDEILVQAIGDWDRTEGILKKAFKLAQKKKVAVVFDELSRAGASARNLILKAMDPVLGAYELQDFTSDEILRAPIQNLKWIATCNLGAAYSGSDKLDEALLDRFEATRFVGYDEEAELRMLESMNIDSTLGKRLIKVAVMLRHAYKNGDVPSPFSTRMLKTWAKGMAAGQNPVQYALDTWVQRIIEKDERGYPDLDQQKAVVEIIKKGLE